ncbi:MAG: hypothetical protein ACKVZ0_15925 [Gemmatimonadales bacterium]
MPKRSTPIKNPDQDVDAATFDVLRDVTGGETPADALARAEAEQRRRPFRILDLLRRRPPRGS